MMVSQSQLLCDVHAAPLHSRKYRPDPPRQPQPGELLFEFYRERDHTRWMCELRDYPEPYGVEGQFYRNEEFDCSRRFDATLSRERTPREMAIAWLHEWRKGIEEEGT
jgi:hypothetical protein